MDTICKHCCHPIAMRNPSGHCDHLYFPDNLTDEAKRANGYAGAAAVSPDLEKMKQHLREYRERYVTSAAVDAEIKRLIGEN